MILCVLNVGSKVDRVAQQLAQWEARERADRVRAESPPLTVESIRQRGMMAALVGSARRRPAPSTEPSGPTPPAP